MQNEEKLLKSYRRKILCDPSSLPVQMDHGREYIQKIIPHRDPFLLVDRLTGLDTDRKIICGEYTLSPQLPVFRGHFPQYPVYPGSLQLEAMGQLGLCLVHFIKDNAEMPDIRATRIGGAYYRGEVKPGDTMTLLAHAVEYDTYLGTLLGQTLVNGQIASVAIMEVAFLD